MFARADRVGPGGTEACPFPPPSLPLSFQRTNCIVNVSMLLRANEARILRAGTHSLMKGLSGGQKVKVVLGAAMWNNPHILVMDEPTNFLDRDSLGALAMVRIGRFLALDRGRGVRAGSSWLAAVQQHAGSSLPVFTVCEL